MVTFIFVVILGQFVVMYISFVSLGGYISGAVDIFSWSLYVSLFLLMVVCNSLQLFQLTFQQEMLTLTLNRASGQGPS